MYLELIGFDDVIAFLEQSSLKSIKIKGYWVFIQEWRIVPKAKYNPELMIFIGEVFELPSKKWGYEVIDILGYVPTPEKHIEQRNAKVALGEYPSRKIYETRTEAAKALINDIKENT